MTKILCSLTWSLSFASFVMRLVDTDAFSEFRFLHEPQILNAPGSQVDNISEPLRITSSFLSFHIMQFLCQ